MRPKQELLPLLRTTLMMRGCPLMNWFPRLVVVHPFLSLLTSHQYCP